MQDNQELERAWTFDHGLFTLTQNGWKQKKQVRLLNCIWTVCNFVNFVDSLSY